MGERTISTTIELISDVCVLDTTNSGGITGSKNKIPDEMRGNAVPRDNGPQLSELPSIMGNDNDNSSSSDTTRDFTRALLASTCHFHEGIGLWCRYSPSISYGG